MQTWKLKGMLFFFHSSMTILISYLPVYFQALGLEGSQIGLLLAVGPAAAIIAQPFWGFMSDKWKTVKRILLICFSGALAVGFIMFQVTEYLLLIPVIFLFYSFTSPAGGLGDSLAQKISVQHGVSFGSIRMWGSIGFGTSSLAGGVLLTHIGILNIYYLFAFFILMALFLCFLAPDSEPSKKPVQLLSAVKLIKDKKLLIFLLMIFAIGLSHRINDSFISLYIVELGGNETYIGVSWFLGLSTEVLTFALSVYWLKRYHLLTYISVAAVIYFIRWVLLAFVPDANFLLAVQVLHGISFGLFYLSAFQFVSRLVPEELESTGHLLFISIFFGFAGVIGSILGGNIMSMFNLRVLYGIMAGLALIGLVGSLLYRKFYFNTEQGQNELKHISSTE
ncbi:MFS transporter [Evansella cellulosilytica]|uniref:Major facilitator superfamily MFS_1 n=1 Tax=Evansella cellulosilytica (strain ATCC 21833 / DSM 2522 / FERM P-1141 / JCM 9156 / N-4) TaxID=649639 RepID=E6U243_EVAC2|nr:MFS transporter [Evansella cellulosilytica]ADU30421.1 major facilitator superfamily MFS_1 [Evansella cellulosilytica DSM 2522]